MRIGDLAFLKSELFDQLVHSLHEGRYIGLSAFPDQIETTKVFPFSSLDEIVAQVVGDGHGDVVSGDHQQSVKRVLQVHEGLFFIVESEHGASY